MRNPFSFFFKCYAVNIPSHLLQSIRVYQALMEAGFKMYISPDQEEAFKYIQKHFYANYSLNKNNICFIENISISHSCPEVRIGNISMPLLFPNSLFRKCRNLWNKKRSSSIFFSGLVDEKRRNVINKFKDIAPKNISIEIKSSNNGRVFPKKIWDPDYYNVLSSREFALVPNGDFVWTYRFFEAVLCGAIPIIEEECKHYQGFYYYSMNGNNAEIVWKQSIVEHNYQMARKILTISRQQLRSEAFRQITKK